MAKPPPIEPADLDPPPEYLRQGPPPLFPPRQRDAPDWRRIVPMAVALVTLLAFATGMWFAYGQGVRKGLELTPPLVRADTGPTKVVPVDPGGMVVPNQDKQVFDAVAAQPAPRVERLLPAAEQPMAAPQPVAATPEVLPLVTATPAVSPVPVPAPPAPVPVADATPVPPREAVPVPRPLVLTPPPVPTGATAPTVAANTPAPVVLRPPPAPAAALPSGTYRIQLGAYGDSKAALDGWDKIRKRTPDLLQDLQPTVVIAEVNGRTVQRLQAGPVATAAAASQLCADLKAKGTDCLVVKP